MRRRLSDLRLSEPISPLIDVVANAMVAIFIIMMIYMVVIRPDQPPPPLTLLAVNPPAAIMGRSYAFALPVVGGSGKRAFSITSGVLPPGLEIDKGTGALFGVVGAKAKPGSYAVSIEVADEGGKKLGIGVTLDVATKGVPYSQEENPLRIVRTVSRLPTGQVGEKYEAVIGASGGVEPYGWRVLKGSLPRGVELEGGRIFGEPQVPGIFAFQVEVVSEAGSFEYDGIRQTWSSERDSREFRLEILPPLSAKLRLPDGREGEPYLGALEMNHCTQEDKIEWSKKIPGFSGADDGPVLAGTPVKAGEIEVGYRVMRLGKEIGSGKETLRILPARPKPAVGGVALATTAGKELSVSIPYRGFVEPVRIAAVKGLPEGLRSDGASIRGATAGVGRFAVEVRAEDAVGRVAEGLLEVDVRPPPRPLRASVPEALEIGVGRRVVWFPSGSGGSSSYEWKVTSELPNGLTFENGRLSGSVKMAGEWNCGIALKDMVSGEVAHAAFLIRAVLRDATKPQLLVGEPVVALVGRNLRFRPATTGGIGHVHYRFQGGLPDGVKFVDDEIIGTPAKSGEFDFQVKVVDEAGQEDGPREFRMVVVRDEPTLPRIVGCTLPNAHPGRPYLHRFAAEGGVGVYSWTVTGELPAGLRSEGQEIEGELLKGIQSGSWPIHVSVSDAAGQIASPCVAELRVVEEPGVFASVPVAPPARPEGMLSRANLYGGGGFLLGSVFSGGLGWLAVRRRKRRWAEETWK